MKKSIGIIVIALAVSLMAGCQNEKDETHPQEKPVTEVSGNGTKLEIEGKWDLTANSESTTCFTELNFVENPTTDRDPLSITEKTGKSHYQLWFGIYERQGNEIQVSLYEPKADPFTMAADLKKNELTLQYE